MITFCGALNFEGGIRSFSDLQRMRTERGAGCAFINGEYAVLCYGESGESAFSQPVTVKHNGALYTAVIIADSEVLYEAEGLAASVLTGCIEEGEEYLKRLDFGFSLAIYDGKCGELLLLRSGGGANALFYVVRDNGIYFSSSLFCLMRLYGGCVRIESEALRKYITGDHSPLPRGLFKDILPIKAGEGILCTRWGINKVYMNEGVCIPKYEAECEALEYTAKADIRRALTDSLFAFGYPQFDFTMPALLRRIDEARARGERKIYLEEPMLCENERYFSERNEGLCRTLGVEIVSARCEKRTVSARALKGMDKALDAILKDLLSDSACVLHRLGTDILDNAEKERDIALKIRKKALLCQCALWFEKFNVVLA